MRGTLGSLNQLMICLGILAALVVNVALPVTSWRTMFMLATVPAALLFLGEQRVPEHLQAAGRCWVTRCRAASEVSAPRGRMLKRHKSAAIAFFPAALHGVRLLVVAEDSHAACMHTSALFCICHCTTGMLGSPESPGYLASKGKREDAVAVATKLWGAKGVSQLGESAGEWPGRQSHGAIKCVQKHPLTAAIVLQPTGRQAGI